MKTSHLLAGLLLLIPTIHAETKSDKPADPKRIINASSGFLKEREPEMTAEEYALYERVVNMLATQPEFALKLLQAMTDEKESPSPAFLFILGNAYYASGDTPAAEKAYVAAVTAHPSFLRAWQNLGVLHYSTGAYDAATTSLSKAIGLGDRDPTTLGLLAYSLEQQGRLVAAEVSYMQALAGGPDNADWMEGLLRILVQGRQYTRAESLARSLLRVHPEEPRHWQTLAGILIADGRKSEALAVLETAAGAGLAGADELGYLADIYSSFGMTSEALNAYEQLARLKPTLGFDKQLNYGRSLSQSGRHTEAERVLSALPQPSDSDARVSLYLAKAECLGLQRRWTQALPQLREALLLDPLNGRALLLQGEAYLGLHDLENASFAFEQALQCKNSAYAANLQLANISLEKKDYAHCVESLEAALRIENTSAVRDHLTKVRALLPPQTP